MSEIASLLSIPQYEIIASLFKDGCFDPIVIQDGHKHERQEEALRLLTDDTTEELGFGGGAGGAKSWTGCSWLANMCIAYPGTKWFIGREELKRLRESTYLTFLKVAKEYGLKQGEVWSYNGQDHYIQFANGSRIDLLDLVYKPSDPLYERYGSMEFTGGWIEEAGEVNHGAYDTLKSRVGRHMNDKYGILGKIFITLNPKKNWCHTEFWKPYKAGTLPANRKFLPSLVTDNPFVDKGYIAKLHSLTDKVKKERLLYGNFDYDDDDNALMGRQAIDDLFTNDFVVGGTKYITADIARFGKDNSVIMLWSGFRVLSIHTLKQKSTTEVTQFIKHLASKNSVARSGIIIDEDGVGGGVVDNLPGCNGFVNNSSPLPNPDSQLPENYKNLKTQCYYMLSNIVNEHGMYVNIDGNLELQETISGELEQVKRFNVDGDGKLEIVPKEKVKELLGRSPDYSDTLMMRMFFELKKPQEWLHF